MRPLSSLFVSALLITVVLTPNAFGQLEISYDSAQLTLIDNVTVATLDPGVVKRVLVQPGKMIAQDDALVELDSDLYKVEAASAELNLKIAKQDVKNDVNLRFARKSLAVNEKQLEKSLNAVREYALSISETEIDRLRLERDQSKLSCEQAEMEGETAGLNVDLRTQEASGAKIRLERRSIKSPIAGMVVDTSVQVGESVTAGQPMVRVISLKKLRAKAVFSSKHAFIVNRETPAVFEFDRDGEIERMSAKVFFVSPEILPTEKVFEVWADIDNSKGQLLPGLKGKLILKIEGLAKND